MITDDAQEFDGKNLYIITGLGLTFSVLNTLGSLYIFYQTFMKWCSNSDFSLPMSLRFPFYIAITDFGMSMPYIINIGYTAINEETWPMPECYLFGVTFMTFLLLNLFLITFMAATTWLRVVKDFLIYYGEMILVRADSGVPRCEQAASLLHTISEVEMEDLPTDMSSERNSIEHKVSRKIFQYVLMFLLQYIPILIYSISRLLMFENFVLYTLMVVAFNAGGIGNLYQYINLEGFSKPSPAPVIPLDTIALGKDDDENGKAKL
ncbi:4448_t:CDS:2 [Acaulospora morrowiae]|uniref:4448_t:CDS:1 n=1 Tax=Acaulospora morrowiae TaxID=94023 RepID=A0A9N8V8M0_9GLOM|nr:4448_t:CDS:2 [Acaulospora morrowiae]